MQDLAPYRQQIPAVHEQTELLLHLLFSADETRATHPDLRYLGRAELHQRCVTLDATQSYDVNGDALSYSWSVESAPADATAPLSNLQFDLDGNYVIALTVQDENGVASPP